MPSNLQGNVSYTDPDFERDPTSIVLGARTGLTGETVLGSHPLVPLRRKDDDEPVPAPDAPPPPRRHLRCPCPSWRYSSGHA